MSFFVGILIGDSKTLLFSFFSFFSFFFFFFFFFFGTFGFSIVGELNQINRIANPYPTETCFPLSDSEYKNVSTANANPSRVKSTCNKNLSNE